MKPKMIKKITIIITVLFIFLEISYSQQPLSFSEVVYVDSTLSGHELYIRARSWFAEEYRNAQNVIQMDDKDALKIVGKGAIKYISNIFSGSEGTKGWIKYTLSIRTKDGRYKYTLSNIYHESNPFNSAGEYSFGIITNDLESPKKFRGTSKKWTNRAWKDIKLQTNEGIGSLILSLKTAMSADALSTEEDDW